MVNTVQVNTKLHYSDGTPATGVTFIAELQSPSQYSDGYIASKSITSTVNDQGEVTLDLWPNEAGTVQTFYKIKAEDKCLGILLDVVAIVPKSVIPMELDDIAMNVKNLSLSNSSGNVASIRKVYTSEGLTGGGDLSTNRTHRLDLTTISTRELEPTTDFIIPVQDPTQPDSIRWARLGDLPGVGFDTIEEITATSQGQREFFIVSEFTPESNQLDVYVNGKYQSPTEYIEDAVVDYPPYTGRILLSEGVELGDEVIIKVKQNSAYALVQNAGGISYDGGGTVEDALNALFSQTNAAPWSDTFGDVNLSAGDKKLVSTNLGQVTISLPAFPNKGDSVKIVDITSSTYVDDLGLLMNNIVISRNGSRIMELEEDFIIDQARVSIEFIYSGDPNFGWTFSE